MDRMTSATIGDKKVFFNFSMAVMFDMMDKFKSLECALNAVESDNRDGYEAVIWFAVHMAEDAELCRRNLGYSPKTFLSEDDISLRKLRPLEYAELREAVVNAITLGYNRELPGAEDEERDLGLEELQAKKMKAGE